MKKVFTSIALLFFFMGSLQAQLFTVATCSTPTGSNTYGPMNSVSTANATNRTAVIYPASQLTGIAGFPLTNIYFERSTTTGSMAGTPNFKVYLKEVALTDWGAADLDWATEIATATLVYDGNPAAIVGSTAGWKNFPLIANYNYSGAQNLAVFMEYSNSSASTTISWNYEFTTPCVNTGNSNTTKYANNTTGVLAATLPTENFRRPWIGFDLLLTCYPPTSLVSSNITNNSATISWTAPVAPPADGYEYYYNTTGTAPIASTTPSGTTGAGVTTANLSGLSATTNYYVWVRSVCGATDKSPWSSSILISTIPSNDECANAISLTHGTTCVNTAGTTAGATLSMAAAPCAGNPDDDVWYSFVAANTDAQIALSSVTAVVGTSTDIYFQVFSGSCGGLTSLMCNDPNTGIVGGLTPGETYYIRVYMYGAGTSASFNICVSDVTAVPTGCGTLSQPVTAATVSITPTLSWSAATNASTYDIYLDANNPPTTLYATVYNNNTTSYTVSPPLSPGVYYWYVQSSNSLGVPVTNCALAVRSFTVVNPPANDDCATATPITTQANNPTCISSVAANTTGATISPVTETSCVSATVDNDDIWYSFTATSSSQLLLFSSMVATSGTATTLGYHVYSGTCGGLTQLISCSTGFGTTGSGSTIITGLTVGTAYYLKLFTGGSNNSATFNFCLQDVVPPPANDECAGAITITTQPYSVLCTSPTAAVSTGATQSAVTETSCVTTADNDDIWYSFTATGTSAILKFSNMVATTGTATTLGYHIFSGSCAGLVQLTSCSSSFGSTGSGSTIITGLSIGTIYYLRLFTGSTGNTASFDFCVQDLPVNDECSGAIVVSTQPYNSSCVSPTSASTAGATQSAVTETSCVTTSDNDDVWFSFTATSTTQILRFSNMVAVTGTATTLGYQLFTGTCVALTQAGSCDAGVGSSGAGSTILTGLTAGVNYYLRLFTGSTSNSASFNFCIQDPPPAPANDECAGAIMVTTQPYSNTCVSSTAASTVGATPSAVTETSCVTTSDNDDIWYSFVATDTSQIIRFSNLVAGFNTATTLGFHIFSGSCGTLTQLTSCDVSFGSSGSGSTTIDGLAIGNTYYLRLYSGSADNYATFNFCLMNLATPPANDECAGAIAINTQAFNITCTASEAANTTGAKASLIAETSCVTTSDNDEIWYSFTATDTSQVLRFSNMVATLGTATTLGYHIFSGTCGGLTQLTSCSSGFGSGGSGNTIINGLTIGNTYYLQLFTGGTFNAATFNFCLQDLAPVPANDNCAGAIGITTQPYNVTCNSVISATTSGATPSTVTETSCVTTSDNDDIWYSFTATATSQVLRFSNMVSTLGTSTTLGYHIFSASCGGTQLTSCSTGFGSSGSGNITITGLTISTVYYLQLFTGGTSNSASFDFCLQDPAVAPVNDDCAGAITVSTQAYSASCTSPTAANTSGATASAVTETSCTTTADNDDIWYSFTASGTSQVLRFSNMVAGLGTATTLGYQVFTGTCAGLTQLSSSCNTGFGTAGSGLATITGLSGGTVYYLRLFTGGTSNSAAFDFCIQDLPPAPANNDCPSATTLTNAVVVNGSTLGATESMPAEACASATASSAVDVWYQFTALQNGSAVVNVSNVSATFDAVIQVYSGSCGTLANIGCADGFGDGVNEVVSLNGLVGGQTYFIRVFGFDADMGTFDITVSGAAIPITIEYFRGTKQGDQHLLDWKVNCSNTPTATMEIERSADGRNFTSIYTITATGTRCLQPFNFADTRAFAGMNYYRLKTVDADGKVAYSQIVALLNKDQGFSIVNLVPNPVLQTTILSITSAVAEKMEVRVMDIMGRQLSRQSVNIIAGHNQVSLNLGNLSAGVYNLSVINSGGERKALQFVKQ